MNRKTFLALLAFAVLLLYLSLVGLVLFPFWRALIWAAIIGGATFPVFRRLRSALGGRQTLAASLMTPAVLLILVVPVVVLVLFLTREAIEIYQLLGSEQAPAGAALPLEFRSLPLVEQALDYLRPLLRRFDLDLDDAIRVSAEQVSSYLLSYSTAIVKNSLAFAMKLVVMVLALFFIYKDGEDFVQQLRRLVLLEPEAAAELADRVKKVLSAVIYGVFLTCMIQGGLGGVGYWLVDLPSPVLLGVMTAVAALVPVFGTTLVWVPAGLYLLLQDRFGAGLFLLAWGLVAIGFSDNLLRPLLISGRSQLSLVVVALGLLGGLATLGFLGIIVGPVVLALVMTVLDLYHRHLYPPAAAEERD